MIAIKHLQMTFGIVLLATLLAPTGTFAQQVQFDFADEVSVVTKIEAVSSDFDVTSIAARTSVDAIGESSFDLIEYKNILLQRLNTRRHRPHAIPLMIVGVGGMVAGPMIGGPGGAMVGLGGVVVGVYGALLYFDAI